MPQQTVGTAAVRVAEGMQCPVIRNLGPGNVGMDTTDAVTVGNASIYLKPDESFEFPTEVYGSGWTKIFAIADAADTDVRVAEVR